MGVSIIIPAYNEEGNIHQVLSIVSDMPDIDEVLVVNDGSSDDTSAVACSYGVRVLDLPVNKGKGNAMYQGLMKTSGDIVVFLDADLVGLTKEQVIGLYKPVLDDIADMTLGIFSAGRGATDLAQKLTPFLSGQRAVKRMYLQMLDEEEWTSGYGIEVALSRFANKHGLRVMNVPLVNVTHPMKEEKLGFFKGAAARMKMYWEIAKELVRI
ncbi:MAG TPA: glycosyltransferase family 2 protein [Candidatus Atribacteria bacterium]|nr:glycosyltransferase family 2 protein [Candidatus Atribacteria bacterium]HPT79032.1 glycosyltransferase family 2 protein [Candidatus Atribacteria bacterium]